MKSSSLPFGLLALLLCTVGVFPAASTPKDSAKMATAAQSQDNPPLLAHGDTQAVTTLLQEASDDLARDRKEHASAALERALRIEPDNAFIWHYLARLRLSEGEHRQA